MATTFLDHKKTLIVVILGGAFARAVFAFNTGLGIDETYMVAVGRHWELGYFDHPPLAWWIGHAASSLAGSEAAGIVRMPFIALFAVSTWLMYRLGSELFGASAGLLGAIAMNCAPVLGITTGTWVLPDGPLIAAMLAAAWCLARVLLTPRASPVLWLMAGFFTGLALLSKFHGTFLFMGTGLFLLTSGPHRHWLARSWPYLGAMIALAVASPAIVWNIEHDWASIGFQGARAATRAFRPWMPLLVIAGQAALLAPWIWAPLVWAAFRDGKTLWENPKSWLLICLGIGPIATFTIVSAWSDQKPYFHWAAPGYLMLFPLLGDIFAKQFEAGFARIKTWLAWSIAFDLVGVAGLIALSFFPQITSGLRVIFPAMSDPVAEMVDWNDVEGYLRSNGTLGDPRIVVVARRWYEAAKIDYALHGANDVVCLGEDCRGYNFVGRPRDHLGDDAIIFVPENVASETMEKISRQFDSVKPMPPLAIMHGGIAIARLRVVHASNMRRTPR